MITPTLHYIYDPLCGWCYAAGPMVRAVADAGIPVALHAGGLWEAPIRVEPAKRAHMRRSDARIAELAGVPFGTPYLDGMLRDAGAVFWSRPPIAAIIAAGCLQEGADQSMLRAVQRAHYVEGRRVADASVLVVLAAAIGLAAEDFAKAFEAVAVDDHIAAARRLMQRVGVHGFPGFLLQRRDDMVRLHHEPYYGRPADFVAAIRTLEQPSA